MPDAFPYDEWDNPIDWVDETTATVHYVGHGKRDDLRPTPEWFIRTRKLIAPAWLSFASSKNFGKFLLLHGPDVLPAHIMVDGFLGDMPWAEAQDIYFRAHHDEVIEGPHLEPFEMPGRGSGPGRVRARNQDLVRRRHQRRPSRRIAEKGGRPTPTGIRRPPQKMGADSP